MRYCVNPECPFQVKFGRPAEYQDTASACSDCGSALGEVMAAAAAAAAGASPAAAPWPADLWRRVAVSAAVLAAVVAGNVLQMPGLVHEQGPYRIKPSMTLLSVGWSPFLWAMLLVEVAATLIPGWRRLREDGVEGRRRLWRVALGIGLAFAALQSVTSIQSLERAGALQGNSVTASSSWSSPMLMLVLLGGSLFTVLAARVASDAGLGAGFALVVLGGLISDGWVWVLKLQRLADMEEGPFLGVAFLGAGVAGAVWLFRRAEGRPPRAAAEPAERPRALPFPVAGVLPLLVASGLLFGVLGTLQDLIAPLRGGLDLLLKNTALLAVAEAVIAVNVAIALGVWCHRPSKVAAAWARWTGEPGAPLDLQRAQVGARVRALLPAAIGWNCALVALFVAPALIGIGAVAQVLNLASLVIGVSIALDLIEETRARTASGDLATAWTLIRPYEVEPALEALKAAGIPAHARGLHARATQQLWGVLLPIHILVPPDQVEKARAVLLRK